MTLAEFNRLPPGEARLALERCCGCAAWVDAMIARRPFAHLDHLLGIAQALWWSLPADGWREAFGHHPRIGDLELLERRFASTADLAGREQSAVSTASPETLAALAEGNRAYQEKFGYIFIVFATGRSADEMLRLLRERLPNDPEIELHNAAREQLEITKLRLDRMLDAGR